MKKPANSHEKSDTLEYLTYKYIDINNLYDWYIFIDDTTFVFHNRLIKLLEDYANYVDEQQKQFNVIEENKDQLRKGFF